MQNGMSNENPFLANYNIFSSENTKNTKKNNFSNRKIRPDMRVTFYPVIELLRYTIGEGIHHRHSLNKQTKQKKNSKRDRFTWLELTLTISLPPRHKLTTPVGARTDYFI